MQAWTGRKILWDATQGHNGGAATTALDLLLEMEKYHINANELDEMTSILQVKLAKAFERVKLEVVWRWAMHFDCPQKVLRIPRGYSGHQTRVEFEGCTAHPLQTIRAIVKESK